jgi:hypothetical protein
LVLNLNRVSLSHVGRVEEIAAPVWGSDRYTVLRSVEDLDQVSTSQKMWRDEVAEADRKTVYFLMIEKKK